MNRTTSPAPGVAKGAALIAAVVAFIAYFAVLHALMVQRTWPGLVLSMVLAPWFVAIAVLIVKQWRRGSAMIRTIAAIGVLLAVSGILASADHWTAIIANADLVVYLENALFFGWLSALFATSLGSSQEALVTRMARKVRRGDMPPEVVRYTRSVTIGWALFFALEIVVSTVLYFAGPHEAWSLFINMLVWPLVVLGFFVEYAIRVTTLRHVNHVPLMAGVRAFRERDATGETTRR